MVCSKNHQQSGTSSITRGATCTRTQPVSNEATRHGLYLGRLARPTRAVNEGSDALLLRQLAAFALAKTDIASTDTTHHANKAGYQCHSEAISFTATQLHTDMGTRKWVPTCRSMYTSAPGWSSSTDGTRLPPSTDDDLPTKPGTIRRYDTDTHAIPTGYTRKLSLHHIIAVETDTRQRTIRNPQHEPKDNHTARVTGHTHSTQHTVHDGRWLVGKCTLPSRPRLALRAWLQALDHAARSTGSGVQEPTSCENKTQNTPNIQNKVKTKSTTANTTVSKQQHRDNSSNNENIDITTTIFNIINGSGRSNHKITNVIDKHGRVRYLGTH